MEYLICDENGEGIETGDMQCATAHANRLDAPVGLYRDGDAEPFAVVTPSPRRMIEIRRLESDDGRHTAGHGELMGSSATRWECNLLISAFPGSGQCFLWDPNAKRCLQIVSWTNYRRSS